MTKRAQTSRKQKTAYRDAGFAAIENEKKERKKRLKDWLVEIRADGVAVYRHGYAGGYDSNPNWKGISRRGATS